jgi:MinD-like ATPase involved in chromosome partitioning or flagellar assembly
MTILEFLRACREKYAQVDVRYAHPTLYIVVIDEMFKSLPVESRRAALAVVLDIEEDEIDQIENSSGISVELVSQDELDTELYFLQGREKDTHWLPLMDAAVRDNLQPTDAEVVNAAHFYGFKGGQARSTVLGLFAKFLASDGFKVLVVDVDVEAPSLDLLFDAAAFNVNSTLMGLCGWSEDFIPISAYAAHGTGGRVDVVPCRPRSENFDMDFAAFTVRASLDISIIREGIAKLKRYIGEMTLDERYDIVLFDHRTGIAPSVLPAIREWRGPTVVFVRPDGLSMQAESAFASLFSQNPANPGAFVSFSLDFDAGKAAIRDIASEPVQRLLQTLSAAIAKGAEPDADSEDIVPADSLDKYWVSWYADRALLTSISPSVEELLKANVTSLRQLRDVLGIYKAVEAMPSKRRSSIVRSPSGNVDQGWFIETPEIARLFLPNSPISYVTGRKGTGKTRVHKEMVERKLAEPMFSAADFPYGGLLSVSSQQERLLDACSGDFKKFWWALLGICLESSLHASREEWDMLVENWCQLPELERNERASSYYIVKAYHGSTRRSFLIDGIETAVTSSKLRSFVEELLRFMLTIQSDSKLSSFVFVRLFIRSDLLQASTQNIEQQTSNRILELRWDSDSIFNFVLARIEQSPWFNENFGEACTRIGERLDDIRAGRLRSEEYEPLLLSIFPKKLRRNNIQTITFLDTYFSDAGGESKVGASFYPRLFEQFVSEIENISRVCADKGEPFIEEERLVHTVVLSAHAKAAQSFTEGVTQELSVSLELDEEQGRNMQLVKALVNAFEGLSTPFKFEATVLKASASLGGLDVNKVRAAMQRMRDVGIFETHPKRAGEWRAGRLYKAALRMKFGKGE